MIERLRRGRRLLAEGASYAMLLCIGAVLIFGPASGARAAAGPDVRSFYLISLAQTPLPESADAVLVKSLGSTVRIDEGVGADITFSIAEPMTVEDLEIAFASELSNHGIALVREGEGYRLADISVAMVETPRPIIVGAPLPSPKATIAPRPASDGGPAIVSDHRGKAWWLYAALILVAAVVAGLTVRFGRPLIMGLRRRFAHTSSRAAAATNSTQRDAVVDWLLSRHSVPLPLLASACDRAARLDRPVEQALCDVGAVTEANLADAYCAITGLSRWDPATAPGLISEDVVLDDFIQKHPLRLVEMDDWSLAVACADPLDDRTYAALSRSARRMVTLRVGRLSEISPEGRAASGAEHHAPLVIVPWSRPRPDGAHLLQAILTRRSAAETVQSPAGLNAQ